MRNHFRTGATLAALMITAPAMAWCGNTATNCGAGAPAKQVTCLNYLRTMQVAAKLVPPSNFGTRIIDSARVEKEFERLSGIADKAFAQCAAELGANAPR
jgi:hypothetical protein